ncbi:hypothetical protein E7Z57_14560 [Ralstonia pseudosolanacearum]|uniref:Uncharacterized protein n=1 Tax=Ralstonia solanacearum TaxID=305 RepID=A0AA92EDR7_RALSL|nr:hypothetical protein E7Z57_14560 [Ralstonia pseudosolanacearum]
MIHDSNSNGSEKESGGRAARQARHTPASADRKAIDGTARAGRINGFQAKKRDGWRNDGRADFTFSYKAERDGNGDFSGRRWPRALK